MISCKKFYDCLLENEIDFFSGVPDSLLKDFCAYVTDNAEGKKNIIAANEGNAIAIASGYHLSTGKFGLVYMQNSGLGNTINPLTSLADKEVYSIPMLLLIGWRAEPGIKDEPQHIKMGKVTLGLLETIGIKYEILNDNFEEIIEKAKSHMENEKSPFAIVARKGAFEEYKLKTKKETNYELNREDAIRLIVPLLDKDDIIISTTGMTSRELFELREANKEGHEKDFLTVGCMGHSSSIALGIALEKPERNVYCLDGDGALIMHMGALSTIASLNPKNFKHIVFNNFAHDSVGGQPTAAYNIDIPAIAMASGYVYADSAETKDDLIDKINKMKNIDGPALLEIKVNKGHRKDLGRPTRTPIENKEDFMGFLSG
ncbi:phosphonopyruvate decarboxylase [Candidatus Woesearchaeota archaeon]|nr:phosphonopyruvate decarboxylase [Candidatus Woesearchaeota archaeon]